MKQYLDYEGLKQYDAAIKDWAEDNYQLEISGKMGITPRGGGFIEVDILGRSSGKVGDSTSGSGSSGSDDVSVASELISDLTNIE